MARERIGARRPDRDDSKGSRPWRVTLGLVATVIALSACLIVVESARAGTYVMRNCDVPGHRNSSLAPWAPSDSSPKFVMVDACEAGGGVGFRFVGPQQLYFGEGPALGLPSPSTGPQSQIKLVKVSLWYAARLKGTGQPLSLFSLDMHSDGTFYPWVITGAPGAENLSFEQQLSPASSNMYKVGLACGPIRTPAPPDPCVANDPMPFQVRGMEVTLSEEVPPSVTQPAGTLLADGPQMGVRTLAYAATDPQSGLARVDVLFGDTLVESHDLVSRCSWSDFTVCPASEDETLAIDTRAVPNGSYDVALRVRDAAGNERIVHGGRAVQVANAPPPGSSTFLPYTIVATFKGTSRSTLTVPYGRRVSLRGRVTRGTQPVPAGAAVEVLERLDGRGTRERLARNVLTKADGSFSIGLATSRPSRTVRLAYRPVGGGRIVSRALKLRVRAASRVRASLRGRIVHFSGNVLSRPVAKGGKRVVMEGRSPGSAWTPFKSLRTNRKGRFSGTYRLRVRRPGVTLKVRAVLPREDGYGYLESRSRAVTLRVR